MTKEDAISIMNVIVHMLEPQYDTDRIEDAVDMAIKALEQEPCDDAISRDAVLKKTVYTETEEGWCGYTVDVDYIKSLPPVNPQKQKTGHWRPIYQGDEIIGYRCSECEFGKTKSIYRANYCHSCGARMIES